MHANVNVYANSKIIFLSQQKQIFVLDYAEGRSQDAMGHALTGDIEKDNVWHRSMDFVAVITIIDQYSILKIAMPHLYIHFIS